MFANNPAMCAYVEAKDLHPDADDVLVVSLGNDTVDHQMKILCRDSDAGDPRYYGSRPSSTSAATTWTT